MKGIVRTIKAPEALGPYSQAIQAGGLLFVSGQLGIDPSSARLADESIEAETTRALMNVCAVVEAGGLTMDQVVKTTVYLVDLADFKAMNEVYGTFFPESPPARATGEVKRLPGGARVEIECIAVGTV